jgi:hypothetical protein
MTAFRGVAPGRYRIAVHRRSGEERCEPDAESNVRLSVDRLADVVAVIRRQSGARADDLETGNDGVDDGSRARSGALDGHRRRHHLGVIGSLRRKKERAPRAGRARDDDGGQKGSTELRFHAATLARDRARGKTSAPKFD